MRIATLGLALALGQAGAALYPPPPGLPVDARRIAFDRDGFLWVSGNGGSYRFDGVRWLDVVKLGLPAGGGHSFAVTPDGAIWAHQASALFRLEGGRFREVAAGVFGAPVVAGQFLYAPVNRQVAVWFRLAGVWQMRGGPAWPLGVRLHGEPDGRVWFGGRFVENQPGTVAWTRFNGQAFEQGEAAVHLSMLPAKEVVPAPDGLFTGFTTNVNRFKGDSEHGYFYERTYSSTVPTGERQLAGDSREVWYQACGAWLSTSGREVALPGTIGIAPEEGGGVWAARGAQGVAFAGREPVTLSIPGLPDRPVTGMAQGRGRIFVVREDTSAVLENRLRPRCDDSPATELQLRAWGQGGADAPFGGVLGDFADGSAWVLAKNGGVAHISADAKHLGSAVGEPMLVRNMRQLAFSSDGRLWVAGKTTLTEVRPGSPPTLVNVFPGPRYFSGFASRAAHLTAVGDGVLLRYEKGTWREEPLPACLLSPKPRALTIAGDGTGWYSYRDRPGFTHVTPAGCEHFRPENGYPGDTQFLAFDRRGRLWRGSSAGVFVQHAGRWRRVWAPEGEMHQTFFEDADGFVYFAMGDRLHRLPPQWADTDPGVPPLVSYLEQGGGAVTLRPRRVEARLGDGARLYVASLPERDLPAGAAQLEARFDDGAWRPVQGHELKLDDAPRFARRLELRYAGASAVTGLEFALSVPWWRSYWFYSAAAGAAAWLLSLLRWPVRRWRYHQRKRAYLRSHAAGPEELMPGRLLHGRYRIQELIAEGPFSRVHAAVDEPSGQRVVVKRLRMVSASPEALRRRFTQELAAVSMIRHDGVVPILDAWIDDALAPHLVLPRIEGPTLRAYAAGRALPREEALGLLRPLAAVLAAAHARGVVHGDFKPENVLLEQGRPRVIDFGTSALAMSPGLNQHSRPAGSLQYMAPEQLLGRYSKATDVYAFALVAFELLTGHRYAELELPLNDEWEGALRAALEQHWRLPPAVFIDALRFDPERRASDIAAWAERLAHALA